MSAGYVPDGGWPEFRGSDAEFLEWVAGWLDTIDPILQAIYSRPTVLPDLEAREKVVAWLDGKDVQQRIRAIAARVSVVPAATPEETP